MKRIKRYLMFLASLILCFSVEAGITPGSKDLDAIWFAGTLSAQSAAVQIETASTPGGFVKLPLPNSASGNVTANQKAGKFPLGSLLDGKLAENFGPVFANGVRDGAYKMDLGSVQSVAAITSWSFDMSRSRGAQKIALYGSNAAADPGWDLSGFTPLGTIDTGTEKEKFTAASLRAVAGQSLGQFRWIVWSVSPVTASGGGENTAFQELVVELGVGKAIERTKPIVAAKKTPIVVTQSRAGSREKPNIIFINADDMGVGDVSYATGLAPTPHIDRLAAEGMRFTDAHTASAVCTPSRYALLTGRYNWRTRLTAHVFSNPTIDPLIEPNEPTVASFLKDNGYHTACVGKWHLGIKWQLLDDFQPTGDKKPWQGWGIDFNKPALITPTSHGFETFWGITASLDMPPYLYIENEKAVITELIAKTAGRKGPMDAAFRMDECLQVFAEKSVAYIDECAKEDKPFFLYLPLSSPHSPVVPSKVWQGKSGLGRYGDFLMETDWVVGEVLATLDKYGLAENTLVIFSTDNGCSKSAGIPNLIKQGHNPCGELRGHKADIYEGGHRVPFVVRWPAQVKPNTVTSRLTCQTDFISTCADILGVELADNSGVDSVSFLPTLKDPSKVERDAVVHHSINGSFAIREGDWKLILCKGSGGWTYPTPGDAPADFPDVQLFNLAEDIGETNNLQAEYPERVIAMTKVLKHYVETGRSTDGPVQSNATEVNIYALPIKR